MALIDYLHIPEIAKKCVSVTILCFQISADITNLLCYNSCYLMFSLRILLKTARIAFSWQTGYMEVCFPSLILSNSFIFSDEETTAQRE